VTPAPPPDPAIDLLPSLEPIQLLDEQGRYHPREGFPIDLSAEELVGFYRTMVMARRIDTEAIALQRQGQLGVYASLRGQEAAQVGSASALEERDWIFPAYREGGAVLVRGVDPGRVLHQYRGTWFFDHDPYERNLALWTTPIGTQTLHAVGFAMGAKLDRSDLVVLTYLGDGATSEGDPHEAMNFAGVYDAPCIFFVQNNQWAISTPLSKQTAAPTIAHKAVGYGMPGQRVDGNDVLATYAVTRWAVERARRGEGPCLIEAVTFRMEAHTTSDDSSRYRSDDEVESWRLRDPIDRFRRHLLGEDLLDDAVESAIHAEAEEAAAAVRSEIYDAPHGDPLEVFDHVYVDPRGFFEEQRAQLRAELDARPDT
jgi:2-oxoisovalerate dehydrogenase E1 component alpha subunit